MRPVARRDCTYRSLQRTHQLHLKNRANSHEVSMSRICADFFLLGPLVPLIHSHRHCVSAWTHCTRACHSYPTSVQLLHLVDSHTLLVQISIRYSRPISISPQSIHYSLYEHRNCKPWERGRGPPTRFTFLLSLEQ